MILQAHDRNDGVHCERPFPEPRAYQSKRRDRRSHTRSAVRAWWTPECSATSNSSRRCSARPTRKANEAVLALRAPAVPSRNAVRASGVPLKWRHQSSGLPRA